MSRTPLALIVGVVVGLWLGWMACFVEAHAQESRGNLVCASDTGPVVMRVSRGYITHRGGVREAPGVVTYWAELDVREWRVRLPAVAR